MTGCKFFNRLVCCPHGFRCAFQRGIPYELRCRTALLALPSMYIDPGAAIADSPEINKRDLHLTLQVCALVHSSTADHSSNSLWLSRSLKAFSFYIDLISQRLLVNSFKTRQSLNMDHLSCPLSKDAT